MCIIIALWVLCLALYLKQHYKAVYFEPCYNKYNQSLEIRRKLGDAYTQGIAYTLNNIDLIHKNKTDRGDCEQAMELYKESLEIARHYNE